MGIIKVNLYKMQCDECYDHNDIAIGDNDHDGGEFRSFEEIKRYCKSIGWIINDKECFCSECSINILTDKSKEKKK